MLFILLDQTQVEEQKLDNSTGKMWKIALVDPSESYFNSSGYFNIINPASGKLLTALAAFDLRVIGVYQHAF